LEEEGMNADMLRTSRVGLVLAGAITLSGCGSDGTTGPGGGPSPSPSPVTITETVVIYGDNGAVPADSALYIDFGIPSAGTVETTVDWTFPSSEVWVAMTTSACNDFMQAFLGQCSHIGTPNRGTSKPKSVAGTVTQGGPGRLWIANFATVDESMALQITLTTTRTASAPVVLAPLTRSWVRVPGSATQAVRAFEKD
jgi:hypothetical protein